jgi:hypothetical protein
LLAQWVDQSKRHCSWLSLDETDSELPSYVLSLLAALRTIHPTVGRTAHRLLRGSTSPPPPRLAAALTRDLELIPDPAVLVLDALARQDPAVKFTSSPVTFRLPFLVLSGRSDPPRLARWLAGRLSNHRHRPVFHTCGSGHFCRFFPSLRQVIMAIIERGG